MSDIGQAIAPVSQESPCGPNVYEDQDIGGARLQPLVDSALGSGRMGAVDGERRESDSPSGIAAWRKIEEIAYQTFRETKHLELAWYFLLCQGHLRGLEGLADGFDVMSQLLSRYPQDLHPAEPDDDYEWRRVVLDRLTDPALLLALDAVPVAEGRVSGSFNLAAYRKSVSGEGVDFREIEQGYAETVKERPTYYQQLADHCAALRESITRLSKVVAESFQSYEAPVKPLESRLAELESVAGNFGAVPAAAATEGEVSTGAAKPASAAAGPEGISSREDVVRMLNRIVQFYQRTEPTSPVPLMLERAQRVAMMDFKEIVKEFNLSGSPSIQDVLGWRDEN